MLSTVTGGAQSYQIIRCIHSQFAAIDEMMHLQISSQAATLALPPVTGQDAHFEPIIFVAL
jgi:hypothetical protein